MQSVPVAIPPEINLSPANCITYVDEGSLKLDSARSVVSRRQHALVRENRQTRNCVRKRRHGVDSRTMLRIGGMSRYRPNFVPKKSPSFHRGLSFAFAIATAKSRFVCAQRAPLA